MGTWTGSCQMRSRPKQPRTTSHVSIRSCSDGGRTKSSRSFGRAVVDDSGAVPEPHNPARRSREHGIIAIALNSATKFVFSRTLKDVTWKNSRLLRELDSREIEAMKEQPGKDMIIFGSGSIVSQLTQRQLIDEYQFAV